MAFPVFCWLTPHGAGLEMLLYQLSDGKPGGPLGCVGAAHKSGAAADGLFASGKPLFDVCNFTEEL